jgi:beta-lactamase regulating signal transducer with metallopeptidase domain
MILCSLLIPLALSAAFDTVNIFRRVSPTASPHLHPTSQPAASQSFVLFAAISF